MKRTFPHRPDRLLDRHVRVDPVLVVEVDVVGAEPAQRLLGDALRVLRRAVDAAGRALEVEAELGRDLDLVAVPGEGAPDQLLVRVRAVDLGGVEERDAEVERPRDRGDPVRFLGGPVGPGHPHAAEPLGRHLESLTAQFTFVHRCLLRC
jgi:hypothetical protein